MKQIRRIALLTLYILLIGSIISTVVADGDSIYADRIHTGDDRINLFCCNDKDTPYNAILRFTVDIFSGEGSCSGTFYFKDKTNNVSEIIFTVAVSDYTGGDKYGYDFDKENDDRMIFSISCFGMLGRNKFEVNFGRYYREELGYGEDVRLYCMTPNNINDDTLIEIMYDNYFDNDCLLNGDVMSENEYFEYHEHSSGFGVFYSMGDKYDLHGISIEIHLPSNDFTFIISIAIISGTAISGYGLYKFKKSRGADV